MRQWYSDGLENRFPSGYPGSIPGLGVYKKMDLKILKLKFKEHLIRTVGKKSTKKEMNLVDKKIRLIFNKIYNKPDKEEAFIIKAYNEKLSKLWKKVVANETLFQEVLLFYKYTKVKPFFHIASLASGLAVYELFLAKEIVPFGEVSCFDISQEMNKRAKKFAEKLEQTNVKIITASAIKIPLEENSQDIVIARRTGLSNDKNWRIVLKEAYRIIKKNKDSTFLYTVDKRFNVSLKTIKNNLLKSNFNFIALEDFNISKEEIVSMVVARPIV